MTHFIYEECDSGFDAAHEYLDSLGAKFHDSGSYGQVYVSGNKAYKYGQVECNYAYLGFVEAVLNQENPSPYFPKIQAVTIFGSGWNSCFVVEMERLAEIVSYTDEEVYQVAKLQKKVGYCQDWGYFIDKTSPELLKKQKVLPEVWDVLQEAKKIAREGGKVYWDLHRYNFMHRGKQLVIVDPLY